MLLLGRVYPLLFGRVVLPGRITPEVFGRVEGRTVVLVFPGRLMLPVEGRWDEPGRIVEVLGRFPLLGRLAGRMPDTPPP